MILRTASNNCTTSQFDARMRRLLLRLGARCNLDHVSLALAGVDGQQRWAGTVGPDAPAGVPVDPQAPFFIASITKRFVATLALQAHELAELDLDCPLTTYLPDAAGLHVRAGVDRTAAITLRHLASHTAGLPDFLERRRGAPSLLGQLRAGIDVGWTWQDVLAITRDQQRPHFVPQDLTARAQRARYSETGFQLLIRVLEQVTGMSYPALLADRIIGPLSLTRTWHPATKPADPNTPDPSPLHAGRRRVHLPNMIAASNDLFSTTADLLTFESALSVGEPFKNPATRHLFTERRNRLANAPVLRYGLGTMLFTINRLTLPRHGPVTLVGHSGSTGTWLFTCPELGVQLAGSIDQTQARSLPFRIMAQCLRAWVGSSH